MSETADDHRTLSTADDEGTVVQDDAALEFSRQLSRHSGSPPPQVPGYETVSCLGVGSFGSVWLREVNTGRHVAIKFYSHRRGLDWSLLSREVEKLAVLYTSRNIVGLLDVGWNHDPPYFVMEYLENGSLAARLKEGPLPVDETVQLAKAIAAALVHAHGSGILHCDVKPANVLLDGNFEPRLGDFGQSRLSDDQSPALGTMFYMAPEQADLQAVPDARWDVYALGALLYHMLCGHPPHRTRANEARIRSDKSLTDRLAEYRRIIDESPRPDEHRQRAGVDRNLADIIDRCLHPDPQQRSPNAQAVLDALEQRDQSRAKRPLILLGFLGPILFLLAMTWIARSAIPEVVDAAKENLIDQKLATDEAEAALLADGVRKELNTRLRGLEGYAASEPLRQFIRETANVDRESLSDMVSPLAKWKDDTDQRLVEEGRTPDSSFFVTDARGDQIARHPTDDTIGDNFAYRAYFHGGVKEYDPGEVPADLSPSRESFVSTAFRSKATNQYMVALRVPVFAVDGHDEEEPPKEVIGVLARTIHLTDLLSPWEQLVRGDSDEEKRFLSLVDTREGAGFLLDHHWMTERTMKGLSDSEIDEKLRFDDGAIRVLREQNHDRSYRDPVASAELDSLYDGEWLAAFAPVRNTGWVAVVQERSDVALQPAETITSVFLQYGIWALVVFSVMLGILWYLIHRASN